MRWFALTLLMSSAALAGDNAKAVLQKTLLTPLEVRDGKYDRFSRVQAPPRARRIRILDEQVDSAGEKFVNFELDSSWSKTFDGPEKPNEYRTTTKGCVYVSKREVFVKSGEHFQPAAMLLGKKTNPADAHVCKPSAELSTR